MKTDKYICIELGSYFRRFVPKYDPSTHFMVYDGAGKTVKEIIESLGIPAEAGPIVTINREPVRLETILDEGDLLGIFPAAWGG